MRLYLKVLKHYTAYHGRAGRGEYWIFTLIQTAILGLILPAIDGLIGAASYDTDFLTGAWSLATITPWICLAIRRLHDTGRSGWWFCIAFIPIVGTLIFLVFMVEASSPADNQYGACPKK